MSEIKRAIAMANKLIAAQNRVAEAETALAALKEEVRKLSQEDLPELMTELEIKFFGLDDGSMVSVTEDIICGISEANRRAAHAWLTEHDYGSIIKTEVKVAFPAGELEAAAEFATENSGELKEFVHPMTLKSFLKERLAAGEAVPAGPFGIIPYNKVKIELPKASKTKK